MTFMDMPNTRTQRRPVGVAIFAVLLILEGIIGALAPLFVVGIRPGGSNSGFGWYVYGFILVLSVLTFVMGYGLWKLQKWALQATVTIEFVYFIFGFFNIFHHDFDISLGIGQVVVSGLLLLYFTLGGVKSAFGVTGKIF